MFFYHFEFNRSKFYIKAIFINFRCVCNQEQALVKRLVKFLPILTWPLLSRCTRILYLRSKFISNKIQNQSDQWVLFYEYFVHLSVGKATNAVNVKILHECWKVCDFLSHHDIFSLCHFFFSTFCFPYNCLIISKSWMLSPLLSLYHVSSVP